MQAGWSLRSAGAGRVLRSPAGRFHRRGNFAANRSRWKHVPSCLLQMRGWLAALGAAQMAAAVNAGKGFFFESCCKQTVIDGCFSADRFCSLTQARPDPVLLMAPFIPTI